MNEEEIFSTFKNCFDIPTDPLDEHQQTSACLSQMAGMSSYSVQ
jgi:hypothetical protein